MTSTFESRQFGTVEYSGDAVLEFPQGLAGFEQETRFVLIERAESAPLVFLQSMANPDLCFVTVPVKCLDEDYRVQLDEETAAALGIETGEGWEQEVLCLAILTVPEGGGPTANLRAPVVIHRATRRAAQAIQFDSAYPFHHPLEVAEC